MRTLARLIENNRRWAAATLRQDPQFFERLSQQQQPEFLWIGCSDSRVPANQIVDLAPGEMFVHRNIANQVIHSDMNCMSVLEYAVDVLGVKHIIVCGHYGCGGVRAAVTGNLMSLAGNWIRHVREAATRYADVLAAITDEQIRYDRLCELNVVEQVNRLCHTTVIEDSWARGRELCVHGWIYSVQDGLLNDLNLCLSHPSEVAPAIAAVAGQAPSRPRTG